MISIFPPNYLTVLITNPKTPPGVYPADGPLGAGDPAAPAFQAPLVGKGHVIFPEDIAFCRAGIETGFPVAAPAFLFLQGDMDLPVDIKFIEGQFLFYFQIAFLAFQASERRSQKEIFPCILSFMT
jgi:hypothetical protein